MRTYPDVTMRKLMRAFEEAHSARERGLLPEAREAYTKALAGFGRYGLDSPTARCVLAQILLEQEELHMAIDTIFASLELDPLDPVSARTLRHIISRTRAKLAALEPGDAQAARLYALLQQCDGVDVSTHLVMVRHYVHAARFDEARRLLEALCLVAPASADVWRARADLADAEGDALAAATARAEAQCRAHAEVPWALKLTEAS